MPYIIRTRGVRSIAAAALSSIALIAAIPAAAHAACSSSAVSQVFAPLGDTAAYAPIAGGTFEAGAAGWSLSNAELVSEQVPTTNERHALVIKPKGRAVSPAFCVSSEYPTFRFMDRLVKGGGKLNVAVTWSDTSGPQEATVGELSSQPSWQASPVLPLASVLPLAESGGSMSGVRLAFTVTHPGLSVAISDVYLDPYSR
jgi:hypothetical protein